MSALTPRPSTTSNDPATVDAVVTGTVPTHTANATQSPAQGNTGNSAIAFSKTQMLAKSSDPTKNTSTTMTAPASAPLIIPPTSFTFKDHLEYTFQILGITAAIVFGIWSIKSYSTSMTANSLSTQSLNLATAANDIAQMSFQQTIYQNRLALLSFCVGNTDVRFNETCVEVFQFMAPAPATATSGPGSGGGGLASIASAVGIAPASSASMSNPESSAEGGRPVLELPFGAIVGIIVAVVVIAGVIAVILMKRTPSPHSLQRHRVDEERIRSKA
ncbi:hypothetical protein C8R44DRAFT_759314 [Mycena epipterygia]|nr:hypothetical protein C8R44DRAFT_759314 [Mycena epipterygia]